MDARTEAMVELLREAVGKYGKNWSRVASYMSFSRFEKSPNAWRKLHSRLTRVSRDKITKENVSSYTSKQTKINLSKGEISSDKVISVVKEADLYDETALLLAHGFSPDEFELVSAKSSIWDAQTKQSGKEIFYSSRISVRKTTGLGLDAIKAMYESLPAKAAYIPVADPHPWSNLILELTLADLHLNKLAWHGTVAQDYDLNIACDRVRRVVSDILSRIGSTIYDEIIIPIGNDLFNEDGNAGTTAKGTPQDSDTRFPKVYAKACELFPEIIDALRPHARQTTLVLVQGNHDKDMSFVFAMHLKAWYRDCKDVVVDGEARVRKYLMRGKCMICLGHFVDDKRDIGSLIPSEAPVMWGLTRYREAHGAHLHKESVAEHGMLVFRRAPSLVSPDEWHAENGYIHAQRHACYIWDRTAGMIGAWYQTV